MPTATHPKVERFERAWQLPFVSNDEQDSQRRQRMACPGAFEGFSSVEERLAQKACLSDWEAYREARERWEHYVPVLKDAVATGAINIKPPPVSEVERAIAYKFGNRIEDARGTPQYRREFQTYRSLRSYLWLRLRESDGGCGPEPTDVADLA